jgi:hypothetical protein
MGHIKYGPLPATRNWNEVVSLIAGGASVRQIATATVHAAERGFRSAANDQAVIETYWLFIRLPLAARSPAFALALRDCGVQVVGDPGLLELAVAFNEAIDARTLNNRGRTDVAEMAQTAAVETINGTVDPRASSLFGSGPSEVRWVFSELATTKQFGLFARPFFSRFAFKILAYLLSKTLPQHVGPGRRFRTQAEHERFIDALRDHCHEATAHHARFAGDWFSLHRFQSAGDIDRDETQRFFGHAMTKLIDEFRRREGTNGN